MKKTMIRIYAFILAITIIAGLLAGITNVRIAKASENQKVAYLTFDDGPSKNTEKVLDILKSEGVHATFFVIKPIYDEDVKFMKRAFDEGNVIGNHTYEHDFDKVYASEKAFWSNFNKEQELIESITGRPSCLFRFPGGSKNSVVTKRNGKQFNIKLGKELEEKGIHYFNWDVDSGDGMTDHASAASIYNNVMKQIKGKDKAIILMHDSKGKKTTIEALPRIIKSLKEQGYTFDTLENYNK